MTQIIPSMQVEKGMTSASKMLAIQGVEAPIESR